MTNLSERTVMVVGGSSGIGLGIAQAAARAGADVVIVGRSTERLAAATRALDGARSRRAIAADATREVDVERLFAEIGALDHLVVTAADLRYAPVGALALEDARAVIDAKLIAALLLAKHASSRLRDGGSIVLTTGVAADRPAPKGALVATVNGALEALARALAIELAPIRVNALSPGCVDTPLWDRVAPALTGGGKEAVFARLAPRLPVGRVGRPEDLAHAALFLMENRFATGATLHVDGGHRLV